MRENQLAWYPHRTARPGDFREWVAMAPELNEAIMSTIAITLARQDGHDVVTDNGRLHHALVTLSEREVFDKLLNLTPAAPPEAKVYETVDELAQVVLTAAFDLSSLTAEQIAELLKEGDDLRRFKSQLVKFAEELPEIHDPARRQERLAATAEAVIKEANLFRSALKRLQIAAEAVVNVDLKSPDWVQSLLTSLGAAGGSALAFLGQPVVGAGIGLFCVGIKVNQAIQKYRSDSANPYALLTRIERKGALRLALPSRRLAVSAGEAG